MAQLKGKTLTLKSKGGTIKVEWKQGSFLGMDGDQSQRHQLYSYVLSSSSGVPVYIQSGYSVPSRLAVDSSLQYGIQNGVIFFCLATTTRVRLHTSTASIEICQCN